MAPWRIPVLVVLALALPWAPARAGTFTATEEAEAQAELSGFNLILSGNLTTSTETEGAAVIGGSITGATHFCFNGCSGDVGPVTPGGPAYGALTVYGNVNNNVTMTNGDIMVGGNVATGATLEMSHNGNAYVGGSNAGEISDGNLYVTGANTGTVQNGTAHTGQPLATTFPYNAFAGTFGNPLADLSTTLATLNPNLVIASNPGNNYVFNAMPTLVNGVLVTVYQISASLLSSMQNIAGFNLNGADVVVVNVLGSTTSLPNLNNFAGASAVIWNMVNETGSLSLSAWSGTLLAVDANVTNGGIMTGTLVAASLTQDAELHSQLFSGNLDFLNTVSVPEPPAWAVLASMLPVLALLRRRRRRRQG
jgi:choice-of-anchor A domain-containing protein